MSIEENTKQIVQIAKNEIVKDVYINGVKQVHKEDYRISCICFSWR